MKNISKWTPMWTRVFVVLLLPFAPLPALAKQPMRAPGFKAALASVRAAAAEIKLAQLQPKADSMLADSLRYLDAIADSMAWLDSVGTVDGWTLAGHDVRIASEADKREWVSRMRRAGPGMDSAYRFVKNVANGFIRPRLDSARQEILLKPLNAFETKELENALAERMQNLEMLEIKYGPNSAKLNVLEVLANHFLLRGFPWFGLDAKGNPGPLELVLSYSTSYVTPAWSKRDGTGILVTSACEGGLRFYFLRHGWGRNALLPAYMTVGVLAAAKEEGALRNPFETAPDPGVFASWGAVKAGVIFGDDTRLMLNRQFQFIPYLF